MMVIPRWNGGIFNIINHKFQFEIDTKMILKLTDGDLVGDCVGVHGSRSSSGHQLTSISCTSGPPCFSQRCLHWKKETPSQNEGYDNLHFHSHFIFQFCKVIFVTWDCNHSLPVSPTLCVPRSVFTSYEDSNVTVEDWPTVFVDPIVIPRVLKLALVSTESDDIFE